MNRIKNLYYLVFLFGLCSLSAQQSIDGSFPFQTDPAKKYSIYIPSEYKASEANELMLALHPLNPSRWNAQSWRDTLIDFAEANNLLLIAPDGGLDGRIDDPIDTAFTSVVLDSMSKWYNIDQSRVYAMGFSWGGLTTYTYGLNHPDKFAGFMPIGAAINGSSVLNGVIDHAKDKSYYIIHGSNDSPNVRFTPLVNAVESAGACVESRLLQEVGHTIDFPNRNQILKEGIDWIRNRNCGLSASYEQNSPKDLVLYPNPITSGQNLFMSIDDNDLIAVQLLTDEGQIVLDVQKGNDLLINELPTGIYFLIVTLTTGNKAYSRLLVY